MSIFREQLFKITIIAGIFFIPAITSAANSDLDDGISRYTDDRISAEDQLGSPDTNFGFIEMRAKSQVGAALFYTTNSTISGYTEGTVGSSLGIDDGNGNINSVTLYPGSAVYGDIIIIDSSTGDKTQLVFGDDTYSTTVGSDLDTKAIERDLSDQIQL